MGVYNVPFDYTINISNTRPLTISNIVFTDTAPAGVTFNAISVNPAGLGLCQLASNTYTCTINALAPGQQVTFTLNATYGTNAAATITNTPRITST